MRLRESKEEPTPSFGWIGPATAPAHTGPATGPNVRMLGAMMGTVQPGHRRAQQLQILALGAPHVAAAAEGAQVSAVRLMPGLDSVGPYE